MKRFKMMQVLVLALAVMVVPISPVSAQVATDQPKVVPQSVGFGGSALGAGLGMGITIIGAGYGLGRIGSAALEGMARQPEVAPRIQTAMLIIAAMLEGATLASVVLCFVIGFLRTTF